MWRARKRKEEIRDLTISGVQASAASPDAKPACQNVRPRRAQSQTWPGLLSLTFRPIDGIPIFCFYFSVDLFFIFMLDILPVDDLLRLTFSTCTLFSNFSNNFHVQLRKKNDTKYEAASRKKEQLMTKFVLSASKTQYRSVTTFLSISFFTQSTESKGSISSALRMHGFMVSEMDDKVG